jgi:hypothetical protein
MGGHVSGVGFSCSFLLGLLKQGNEASNEKQFEN